jgi:predicted outer membrane repeat protein
MRKTPAAIAKLNLAVALMFFFGYGYSVRGAAFIVNTTADTHAASPATSPNDGNGNISLRSALEAANAQSGATITVGAGTYNLSLGELSVAPLGGLTILINGAGADGTSVVQTDDLNRVFNIDVNSAGATTVTISGLTISGGSDQNDILGGAGILAGSVSSTPLDSLTLQNCVLTGNHCKPPNATYTAQPGGGVQMAGGNLTIVGCTFSNNTAAASQGGAIAVIAPSLVGGQSGGTLTISGSTFEANSMTNGSGVGPDGGGAIYLNTTPPAVHSISDSLFSGNYVLGNSGLTFGGAIYLNTGTLNLSASTFTGNSATGQGGQGGAIYVDSGTLNVSYCRIVGNTASASGSGIFNHSSNSAITSAQNNWWGCNSGPGASGCDTVASDSGNTTFAPWIILTNAANPNPILINQSTTLTASFLQNSAGTTLSAANLGTLIGLPIVFDSPVLGTLSSPQATIQANGTATVTFNAGSTPGNGHANATVDNGVSTADITIYQIPVVTTSPVNQAACLGTDATFSAAADGAPAPVTQWQVSTDNGTTWGDLSGATSPTLVVSSVAGLQDGNRYRAVFTNLVGGTTSVVATLTVNAPPVANADTIGTVQDLALSAPVGKFLANDTSPINGTLTVLSVTSPSTAGGTVSLAGSSVSYTPPNGFQGSDSFTYTLSDGRCTAQGTVNVTIGAGNAAGQNQVSLTVTATNRVIRFSGIPARNYVIQWAPATDGPWSDFPDGSLTAGAAGLLSYTDSTEPVPPTRFYRTRVGP